MADLTLGPFVVGIDNVSPDTTLHPGAVRDAVNVNFDLAGGIDTRPGYTPLDSVYRHSLWRSASGISFCVESGFVCSITCNGTSIATLALYPLRLDARVSFTDMPDGGVAFATDYESGRIDALGAVSLLGVETPGAPGLTVAGAAGDKQVTIGAALSYISDSGEESALSEVTSVTCGYQSSLNVALRQPSEAKVRYIRIYLTGPDGDALFRVDEAPIGIASWLVSAAAVLGDQAQTQFHDRLQGAHILRYWNGRLFGARGRNLLYTPSLRYGLIDLAVDFTMYPGDITMLQPLIGGLWLGTTEGVYFLAGTGPGTWQQKRSNGLPPLEGSGGSISSAEIGPLGQNANARGEIMAIWLAGNGFVLGTSEGRLIEAQATHIRLPAEQLPAAVSLAAHNRQVIAVLN